MERIYMLDRFGGRVWQIQNQSCGWYGVNGTLLNATNEIWMNGLKWWSKIFECNTEMQNLNIGKVKWDNDKQ